ncbi:SpoIIE family protein phosphatase [Halothiobacillus neapolitanus]|uniref:Protein serine/threonine phosphatase n=1 Tax=Halothiobacillus neapolitanus (strain ATCC 23641 / DSM 15147 / CIP 104769 / NCIMB 8539 / c2) TaxID=555778 RepID=D0L0P2_HALNC|nr:SpoIIE family protein phosphatase [Halothiobacillus neapolitanus]ACX96265.1 protein serine/threonine phosphatase [Halothiobacillus neapolitanus c2]TDN66575.1 serine phosphatase RsbU (regulator of sigma subunit) [Halothiobacillus neapolitanus]
MLREIRCAGDLVIEARAITPDFRNEEVLALFGQQSSLTHLPVLMTDGRPLGLINRNIFHSMMTKPYYPELYSQKSCITFMDKEPLIVEANLRIEQLTALAVEAGNKVFADGFIIVQDGKYLGIGQVLDLMHAMTELQARQHRQLVESIEYASVIQQSLLKPSEIALEQTLPDNHWLIWQPRDVVGGDIFHFSQREDGFLAILFDCTGHGVPGAFMTLIAESALEQALNQLGDRNPAALMATINQHIKHALNQHQDGNRENSDDGLDGLILRYERSKRQITYAGAHSVLYSLNIENDAPITLHTGDRKGVGYASTPLDFKWHNHTIAIDEPSRVFMLTDGVIDQIGGPRKIAFGKKRLTQFLTEQRQIEMPQQKQRFIETFSHYQGTQTRRDDVTLLALSVTPA